MEDPQCSVGRREQPSGKGLKLQVEHPEAEERHHR